MTAHKHNKPRGQPNTNKTRKIETTAGEEEQEEKKENTDVFSVVH